VSAALTKSILSTATGAQTFDPDHYSGLQSEDRAVRLQIFGREGVGSARVHAAHSPEVTCAYRRAAASACPRRTGRLAICTSSRRRRGRDANNPGALDKKTVCVPGFRGVVRALHRHLRTSGGQLWRNAHLLAGFIANRPVPDARHRDSIHSSGNSWSGGGVDRHAREFLDDVLFCRGGIHLSTNAGTSIRVRIDKEIFHRPGDGSSIALRSTKDCRYLNLSTTGRSDERRFAPFVKKTRRWNSGFLRFAVGMFAALCFAQPCRCLERSRGRLLLSPRLRLSHCPSAAPRSTRPLNLGISACRGSEYSTGFGDRLAARNRILRWVFPFEK